MVFRKEKSIVLKGSTSALANNLSVQIDLPKNVINYAVVHKSVVNMVTASTDGALVVHRQIACKEPSASSHGSIIILQARLLTMPSRMILVMTSQKGIQMFDADASIMLYWYALGDMSQSEEPSFGRGICSVGDSTICVGNHEGHILVFDVPSRGTNITLAQTLKGHNSAICTLESTEDNMVSTDETGNIIIWQCSSEGDIDKVHKIAGVGYPCTSIGLWEDYIVGSFGSGHLRVYSIQSGSMTCEVTAHARWINAVDIAHRNGMVLTAGDDSFVRVWHLNKSGQLENRHSEHITDLQLQGAKFIGRDGRAFGCTGYDSNEILFYTQA